MAQCDRCMFFPCTTNSSVLMQKRCPAFKPIESKMTNVDRIRAMTDEELAEWISYERDDDFMCNTEAWLRWLKQEATDG